MAAVSEQCVRSVALSYWMLPQSCGGSLLCQENAVLIFLVCGDEILRPQALKTGDMKWLSYPGLSSGSLGWVLSCRSF